MSNFDEIIKLDSQKNHPSNKKEANSMLKTVDDFRNENKQLNQLQHTADKSTALNQLQAIQDQSSKTTENKDSFEQQSTSHNSQVATPIIQKKEIKSSEKKENLTGLPDDLKYGIETLSGTSLNDVKVHYNSREPAQLKAHAFAQGSNIHLAPGQEKHLPHEAWHVVQQKRKNIKPTLQMKGDININDDKALEKEADVMGEKALQLKNYNTLDRFQSQANVNYSYTPKSTHNPIQLRPTMREAGTFAGKKGAKGMEYLIDGLAHPFVSGYHGIKRASAKDGSLGDKAHAAVFGGKDNEFARAKNYPWVDAYGSVSGNVMKFTQSVSAVSGEVMKWSGSCAATGGLIMLAVPAAAPFVTAATGVTASALAAKTATRGIHAAYAAECANVFFDQMNRDQSYNDENLKKYFYMLADSKHQNHGFGAALFQTALLLGGGIGAENAGGANKLSDQAGNFMETVGLKQAGTNTGEALTALAFGTVANSQDDIEEWGKLNSSGRDEEGADVKFHNRVAGIKTDGSKDLDTSYTPKDRPSDQILSGGNDALRWEEIKKDPKFAPPKNKSWGKSKSLMLNPFYLLAKTIRGLYKMGLAINNSFKSKDKHKALETDNQDQLHIPRVSENTDGREGLGRRMVKGAATGIGGSIAATTGAATGALGGLFVGGSRGFEKGKNKGANLFKHKDGDGRLKRMAKKAGNFAGGALGGVLGGIGGAVAGSVTGAMAGGAAGAMNVKDSVYGPKASKTEFAKNTALGGFAGGIGASKAIAKADNISEMPKEVDDNRSIEVVWKGWMEYLRKTSDDMDSTIAGIEAVDSP